MENNGQTMKAVFTVVERGTGKSYWTRVGVGFVNRDGSITLKLDAIPVNAAGGIADGRTVAAGEQATGEQGADDGTEPAERDRSTHPGAADRRGTPCHGDR